MCQLCGSQGWARDSAAASAQQSPPHLAGRELRLLLLQQASDAHAICSSGCSLQPRCHRLRRVGRQRGRLHMLQRAPCMARQHSNAGVPADARNRHAAAAPWQHHGTAGGCSWPPAELAPPPPAVTNTGPGQLRQRHCNAPWAAPRPPACSDSSPGCCRGGGAAEPRMPRLQPRPLQRPAPPAAEQPEQTAMWQRWARARRRSKRGTMV